MDRHSVCSHDGMQALPFEVLPCFKFVIATAIHEFAIEGRINSQTHGQFGVMWRLTISREDQTRLDTNKLLHLGFRWSEEPPNNGSGLRAPLA